jgi:heme d1 biosynthesis radical SAM protein NirJ
MFRVTQLMRELIDPTPAGPQRNPPGPVVIWNLTRRCNLACKHCYSISADRAYPGELTTPEIFSVMDDLKAFRVPVLILSGGEPLLHPDIWDISARAKEQGFYVSLSSNGALIDAGNIERIAAMHYDYVGISLDGIGEVHDTFRRKRGAFDASLAAVRLCAERGLKVGLRFTLTQDNEDQFPALLELMHAEGVQKFYLSHLNYGGRGNLSRGDDAYFTVTRRVLDHLYEVAYADAAAGRDREYVTGNNDADGVYLWHWARKRFSDRAGHLYAKLVQWGGNASGVNVANIDNLGNVHPDTFWWHYDLGNVKERRFSEIWTDASEPLMAGLKQRPRPVNGRCGACAHLSICNGNTRVRAQQISGDAWAEDPGCYLDDAEIGLSGPRERLAVTPFRPNQDPVARAYAEQLRSSGRRPS